MEINPTAQVAKRPDVELNVTLRRDGNIDSDLKTIPGDSASFSQNGLSMANYVAETKSLPDTRPEVVDYYKVKLIAGNYPPPMLIDALGKLVGQQVNKASEEATR